MNFDNIELTRGAARLCVYKKKCRNVKLAISRRHDICLVDILNTIKHNGDLQKFINEHDQHNQTTLTFSITSTFPKNAIVSNTSLDISKILVRYGADTNAKGPGGNTPLHLCIIYSKYNIMPLLFEHNADPNIKNDDGKTPLELSWSLNKKGKIIKMLQEYEESYNLLDIKQPSDDV